MNEGKKKVVVITSGGLDSTVLYFYLEAEGYECIPLNFHYGSKHNDIERAAAREIFGDKLVELTIDLSFLKQSSLIASNNIDIPKGHYEDDNMKSTVVPFRNGIMMSYAAAIAEDINAYAIAIGNHFGDHSIYPDCRKSFADPFAQAVKEGTYNNVEVLAPFTGIRKHEIVGIGKRLHIEEIMYKTYSCYEGGEKHCGVCGTCVERKEAFELGGVIDKTEYYV